MFARPNFPRVHVCVSDNTGARSEHIVRYPGALPVSKEDLLQHIMQTLHWNDKQHAPVESPIEFTRDVLIDYLPPKITFVFIEALGDAI